MMTARLSPRLIDRLPPVRGKLIEAAPLSKYTWFRVGGPAEVLFRPADRADLAAFLADLDRDVPVTMLGVGSNMLVRDGGIAGVVIRLGPGFDDIAINGDQLVAGAGTQGLSLARKAAEAGLAGLEYLSGIPGSLGGMVPTNAGAYGVELKDVLVDLTALDRAGREMTLTAEELGFSYRHSRLPEGLIVVAMRLQGRPGVPADIEQRIREIRTTRDLSQPTRARTGGSTFANPEGARAWELIEAAGCRGLTIGGAQVSEKHCNFLINTGNASAADLESLGETVRRRVMETSGIALRWEIRRLGQPAGGAA